jgi:hypothetical protein
MDQSLIAKLELEKLQTKRWDCKLGFKPSLDGSGPEVDLLQFLSLKQRKEIYHLKNLKQKYHG